MVKKNVIDGLFPLLDWILRKRGKLPTEANLPGIFIINRWLSMADSSAAQIINATTNRWINKTELNKENILLYNLYRLILPKSFKKISYIKKPAKEQQTDDLSEIAIAMQCSTREIEYYNKTLAEFKGKLK